MKRLAACVLSALLLASPDVLPDPPPGAVAPSAASTPSSPGDRVPELDAAARAIASERALGEGAAVGIAVLDVDSGRLLAAVNEHAPLNPASNAKLYTAAAALATLRGDHRYETTLTGRLDGDAVSGPLALRGFGDPSLSTADLWDMVQELRGFGVRRVEGDIVVDQRYFDEQTTPPAFEQQPNEWAGFRAPVSAVALDENTVTLTVRPGAVGSPAHVEMDPPGFVDVDGSIRTAEGGGADTVELALSGNGGRMTAHVSGAIAGDSRVVRFTRRAEDPRLLAGYALKALLEKADVKVSGGVKLGSARGHTLAKHLSPPLSSLLYALGKQSDNFYAEMIFKTLGGEGKGRPAKSADAADVVTHFLQTAGAMDAGVVIKNGSGLFDANRVTAFGTVQLLRWAWRDPAVQPEYVAQLSVGGVDGTLHKRFRQELTRRRVRAKTGTLDDVIALSGIRPARRRQGAARVLDFLQSRRGQARRRAPRDGSTGRARGEVRGAEVRVSPRSGTCVASASIVAKGPQLLGARRCPFVARPFSVVARRVLLVARPFSVVARRFSLVTRRGHLGIGRFPRVGRPFLSSPDVCFSSPDVFPSSPVVCVLASDVFPGSPALFLSSPDVCFSSPDVFLSSPVVGVSTSDVCPWSPDGFLLSDDLCGSASDGFLLSSVVCTLASDVSRLFDDACALPADVLLLSQRRGSSRSVGAKTTSVPLTYLIGVASISSDGGVRRADGFVS